MAKREQTKLPESVPEPELATIAQTIGLDVYNAALDLQVTVRDVTGQRPSILQVLRAVRMFLTDSRLSGDAAVEYLRQYIENDNAAIERARLERQRDISIRAGETDVRRQGTD